MTNSNASLKGKTGAPVKGSDEFFNRERELQILLEKITRGDSVYIAAPRRIGKTSLMHKAKQCLEDQGHRCLFHDLEGYKAPSEWISKMYVDMLSDTNIKGIKQIAANLLKNAATTLSNKDILDQGIQGILKGFLDATQWRQNGGHLFQTLTESCPEGKRLVIFLDELAVMIQKMQEFQTEDCRHNEPHQDVDVFLAWLRSIQQRFPTKISFVVASSIGLPPLLGRLGLSRHMNAFVSFKLDAWTPEVAQECILALGRGASLQLSEEVIQCMIDLVGWCSPYFIQVLFDAVHDHCSGETCTREEIQAIYEKYVIQGSAGNFQLNHMEERLRKGLPKKEYELAMKILSSVAQSGEGMQKNSFDKICTDTTTSKDSLYSVLSVLEHDGYLEHKGSEWRFLSKLLRDWWSVRYQMG